jgi:hypothetical protein
MSYHTSLGHSLFEVPYGHHPRHFGIQSADTCPLAPLDSWLQERKLMAEVIKQHLLRAQLIMKHHADKNKSGVQFKVGDKVFLKLQPYIQSSLVQRASHKLAFKFFGPYIAIEKSLHSSSLGPILRLRKLVQWLTS